ncbi:Cytoplasmic tRNA 2-thiolation protein 1 [Nosema granulosis]|uniref:Cytoplasmic tRNA 2-thiolation protein 1 n=1 Tax=Nosema granulosis TaxID=83296 RepID=A0A9P6H303_9MICR|nr:Cytoplasmic tRNA 2-thiolation protein 1 [Nosema granulosis]
MSCENCHRGRAIVLRSENRKRVCKDCFFLLFEEDVHRTIVDTNMFLRGQTIGVGISGGKDSTVLAYVLDKLNKKYNYGVNLQLLCIDEGIAGYRDNSIDTVIRNSDDLKLKLKILSYDEVFGINMDEVVKKIGKKNNCTYCGVFRRQALEEAAKKTNCDIIVTGHNADDMAETIVLNLLRGDHSRLIRCTAPISQRQRNEDGTVLSLPRAKPFKYSYQKEIVLYAFHKKLLYFSTECSYSPGAYRGHARTFIKELEKRDSKIITNIIKSGDLLFKQVDSSLNVNPCIKCSHPTSSKDNLCKACMLLETLKR